MQKNGTQCEEKNRKDFIADKGCFDVKLNRGHSQLGYHDEAAEEIPVANPNDQSVYEVVKTDVHQRHKHDEQGVDGAKNEMRDLESHNNETVGYVNAHQVNREPEVDEQLNNRNLDSHQTVLVHKNVKSSLSPIGFVHQKPETTELKQANNAKTHQKSTEVEFITQGVSQSSQNKSKRNVVFLLFVLQTGNFLSCFSHRTPTQRKI